MLRSVLSRANDLCQQLMELLVPTAATTASSSLVLRNAVDASCVRHIAFNGTGHDRADYGIEPLLPLDKALEGAIGMSTDDGSRFASDVR